MDVFSVSAITRHIKDSLDTDTTLRNVFIRGELSNFKSHYSGHCYFTLKDATATLKGVMFKGKAQYLKFTPVNGMKVVANGYITVFERDGQYQLYVNMLLPEGAGELSLAFAQLKDKLTNEGLFDAAHKQVLPAFPRCIGIITSATGAVLRDIVTVAKRRNPQVALCLYPVQVQGTEAAAQIVAGLRFFNERYPVEVLIVGRGGGSMEDLWSFNEEAVVRAIYASIIPVVAAVGHETDYTLADFVCDVRAATPSQAAELIVPDAREMQRYIRSLLAQLTSKTQGIFNGKVNRLNLCRQNKIFCNPQLLIAARKQELDYLEEKLSQQTKTLLLNRKHRLQVLLEKLEMLSPLAVLNRGYGVVKAKRRVINSIAQLNVQDIVEIALSDGSFSAVVTTLRKGQAKDELLDR